MKKTLIGLAGAAILLSSSVAMADQINFYFDSIFAAGRAYDAGGNAVAGSFVGTSQDLGVNTYHSPDGVVDSYDVGRISAIINSTTSTVLFDGSTSPFELTFRISGTDDVLFRPTATPNTADLFSLGLHVDLFQGVPKNYNIVTGAGATDGVIVLSLDGHTLYLDPPTNAQPYNLQETYNYSTNHYDGTALLDATGGAWAPIYDQNLQSNGSDISVGFSLHPLDNPTGTFNLGDSIGQFTLTGTLEGVGNTVVPEPATMLLFGAGLIGLAGISRRSLRK